MYYTDDSAKPGWYPRGIPDHTNPEYWSRHFPHPTDPTIPVDSVNNLPLPCLENGHRQVWIYEVLFADGLQKEFFIPCNPITIDFGDMDLREMIDSLPHQKFYMKSDEKKQLKITKFNDPEVRQAQLSNILKLLEAARATEHSAEVRRVLHMMSYFIFIY